MTSWKDSEPGVEKSGNDSVEATSKLENQK